MSDLKSLTEKNNQAKTEKERFGVCACVYGVCIKIRSYQWRNRKIDDRF